ncbi:MAG: glycosyltransferase family 2 protein [Candidatus Rokuibacteriota bacterium]
MSEATRPALSIVIPVFNEAPSLGPLHQRLARTLEKIGRPYEIIFVDDGSRDASAEILRALRARDAAVRMIRFTRNYGQHAALFAGLERARGEIVVTLDADLQNPPEEIPRLLAALVDGVDVVGGLRVSRRDPWGRRAASWVVNRATSAAVGVRLRDYGCMLRAYRRSVIDRILAFRGSRRYIPVLAAAFASSMTEIPVAHSPREHGRSRYGPLRLLRLAFDLSVQVLALRPIGERAGRVYQEVRRGPCYVIAEVLE